MLSSAFLPAIIKRFKAYKELTDKTFEQLNNEDFFYLPSAGSNSIAIIIQHIHGNAISRWTNFLTEDGEKKWRRRDEEFIAIEITKQDLLVLWNTAWDTVFETLKGLSEEDLLKTIYIRKEPLIVFDALLRQLAHYSYHIGQIVYIGKMVRNNHWETLSISKGGSKAFNENLMK